MLRSRVYDVDSHHRTNFQGYVPFYSDDFLDDSILFFWLVGLVISRIFRRFIVRHICKKIASEKILVLNQTWVPTERTSRIFMKRALFTIWASRSRPCFPFILQKIFFDCCKWFLKWLLHPSIHPPTHPLDFYCVALFIALFVDLFSALFIAFLFIAFLFIAYFITLKDIHKQS